MRASRALAPVYYTSGDRFAHDPALPLPAWPVLDPLRKLAKVAPGTDSARFLAVSATRGRNRLAHALREADGGIGRRAARLAVAEVREGSTPAADATRSATHSDSASGSSACRLITTSSFWFSTSTRLRTIPRSGFERDRLRLQHRRPARAAGRPAAPVAPSAARRSPATARSRPSTDSARRTAASPSLPVCQPLAISPPNAPCAAATGSTCIACGS